MPYKAKKLTAVDGSSLATLTASVKNLSKYVEDEFAQVAGSAVATEPDKVWNAPPPKPRQGTTAIADGTNWNPGQGQGPYYYTGAAWLPMSSANYLPLTGGTITGDLTVLRSATPTTGAIFFGNSGAHYLYYDGGQFQLAGSETINGNLAVTGNCALQGQVIVSGELVAAQDYIRFTSSGSGGYLQWLGGTNYILGSAGSVWHAANVPVPLVSCRCVYVGDFYIAPTSGSPVPLQEPYGPYAAATGVEAESGGTYGYISAFTLRFRQLQYEGYQGAWYTFGYA